MLVEKPTGTIRTAYDLNNDPYLFEATGTEAKRFIDILNADDDGRLLVLPCRCQDCKFFPDGERDQKECGFALEWPYEYDNPCPCKCDDGWYSIKPSPDFFCACGKRKDEDDE